MPDKSTLVIFPGAPVSFVIPWADANGPVNLTGYTASIYILGAARQGTLADLTAAITAQLTQANPGLVTVRIAWDDSWTTGPVGRFAVRIHPPSGDPQATQPIFLHAGPLV